MRIQKTNLFANNRQDEIIVFIILSCLLFFTNSNKSFAADLKFDSFENLKLFNNPISLNSKDVGSLPVIEIIDEDSLTCNTPIPVVINNFTSLTAHINDNVFSVFPLCLGNVTSIGNLIDNNLNNHTNISITGIGCNATIGARNNSGISFPTGTWAGFRIGTTGLLQASVASTVTISTFNNNVFQESHVITSSLIGIDTDLLLDDGTYNAGFFTTHAFNEIRITYATLVGVLFTAEIYHPIVMNFCSGPVLTCNTTTSVHQTDFPVMIENNHTGIDGLVCVLCEVENSNRVIDSIDNNYANIVLTAGVGISGSLAVKNVIDNYTAGTFAGFDIESISLLDANVLDAIIISTYLDGSLQEFKSGQGNLVSVNTSILTDNGRRLVGFVTEEPFDELKISLANLVTLNLGTTKIYNAVVESFCDVDIMCDNTYHLVKPIFPVFINGDRTGIQGVASVGCSVENTNNVINSDTNDYSTITLGTGALSTGSIYVKNAISTFPSGSSHGFTIRDINTLLQVDLFEKITVCTYLDDNIQECKSGDDLIDLSLLVNWIGSGPGKYNIGFRTSLPYDEVGISVGSLASVINVIRVYSAFVDTRGSFGDELTCCSDPINTSLDSICIGENIFLDLHEYGIWESSDPGIATVTISGEVNTISDGEVSFTFVDSISGCVINTTSDMVVKPIPVILITGESDICIGQQSTLISSEPGTWTSSNNSIATINNSGIVTSLSSGQVTFTFTDFQLCSSDPSDVININARPTILLAGDDSICINENTLFQASHAGSWASTNNGIATISNLGLVTAHASGEANFIFTQASTGCKSDTSESIIVNAMPIPLLIGASEICIGVTTLFSTSTDGTWISNNPLVATINNNGLVTASDNGQATFVFTSSVTGCSSNNTVQITVFDKPITQVTGSTSICIANNTTLSPSTGGVWISSNPLVASVNNLGIVTGLSSGSVSFIFTENITGCSSDTTENITVQITPTISITGSNSLCIGENSQLFPTTGGTWASSNNAIANINNSGYVTAVNSGTITFVFTSNFGCASLPSLPLTVKIKPTTLLNGGANLCVGLTTNLFPSTGGIWISTNTNVATVSNIGIVTAVGIGSSKFIYTNNISGCSSDSNIQVIVNSNPVVVLSGASQICIGQNTQAHPTTGGIWYSTNPSVVSILNNGLATSFSSGTANIYFVSNLTGCTSTDNVQITVNPKPLINITGNDEICVGSTTTLSPSTGGTWYSNNQSVAIINNNGTVTALTQGMVKFYFINSTTLCQSNLSASIIVHDNPYISLIGPSEICVGNSTQLFPTNGGDWTSLNTSIASINSSGIVTGIEAGESSFRFTDDYTGCSSIFMGLLVNATDPIYLNGSDEVCIGYNTQMNPMSTGYFSSSNNLIASVNNIGVIKGLAAGKVSFNFTHAITGCISKLAGDSVVVLNCIDPDFNAALVNTTITGNLNTNDEIINGVNYLNSHFTVSKPLQSNAILYVNSNGSYTFIADSKGEYYYQVPVCIQPQTTGCPTSNLKITVINPFDVSKKLIVNTDVVTMIENDIISINVASNDDCVTIPSCETDYSSIQIIDQPTNGNVSIEAGGNIAYTSINNFVGLDTIVYSICSDGDISNCRTAMNIFTINHHSALNTTVAYDDFYSAYGSTTIDGNLMINDSDPEGDVMIITAQGSNDNYLTISQGRYYILGDGEFRFMPNTGFTGSVDITYTLCDNNSDAKCTKATVHILVLGEMVIKARAYLEGSLFNNGHITSSTGRPLMRDNLRLSSFTGERHIPIIDPYKYSTEFTVPSNNYIHLESSSEFDTISNVESVFGVAGDNAIVDWVFIEIRSKNDNTNILATRSALIQRDGDIVDLDGTSFVRVPGILLDSFYLVVRHRTHLGVMSEVAPVGELIDFTSVQTPVFDFGITDIGFDYNGLALNKKIKQGYAAMWSGDANGDGKVKFVGSGDDLNNSFGDVVTYPNNVTANTNFDFCFGYLSGDFNMDGKVKFDNPIDDKNLLYASVLFYPLNESYLSNFDHFIEQVPTGIMGSIPQ